MSCECVSDVEEDAVVMMLVVCLLDQRKECCSFTVLHMYTNC